MGRVLGLDVGARRIGLAVSDELGILATPHGSIQRRSFDEDIAAILALVRDLNVERIVVGLPIGLRGQTTEQTRRVQRFAERLARRMPVPVDLWDERETSWAAEQIVGRTPEVRRGGRIDAVAAAIILQSYLDHRTGMRPQQPGPRAAEEESV